MAVSLAIMHVGQNFIELVIREGAYSSGSLQAFIKRRAGVFFRFFIYVIHFVEFVRRVRRLDRVKYGRVHLLCRIARFLRRFRVGVNV